MIQSAFDYELERRSHASCADLFRYLVVYTLGGAYVDIDVLPGREPPQTSSAIFGRPSRQGSNPVEIRFIQANAGDEILLKLLERAVLNEKKFIGAGGYLNASLVRFGPSVMDRTGPGMALIVLTPHVTSNGMSLGDVLVSNITDDDTPENNTEPHGSRLSETIRTSVDLAPLGKYRFRYGLPVRNWRAL
jgi:hypothetical protein